MFNPPSYSHSYRVQQSTGLYTKDETLIKTKNSLSMTIIKDNDTCKATGSQEYKKE